MVEYEDLKIILYRITDESEDVRTSAIKLLHSYIRDNFGKVTQEMVQLFDLLSEIKKVLENCGMAEKKYLFDFVSVLSVSGDISSFSNTLQYRTLGGVTDLEDWGHQYVKQLIKCCVSAVNGEIEAVDFSSVVEPIAQYLFKHNSEVEAIDFLLEVSDIKQRPYNDPTSITKCNNILVNKLDLIVKFVDVSNFNRVYGYLNEMNKFFYLDEILLRLTESKCTMHLIHLIQCRDYNKAIEYVKNINHFELRKQCLYILARCNIYYPAVSEEESQILENKHISDFYLKTAENLEILQCKKIDHVIRDVTKDKAVAAAICNSFIHMGYCRDPAFLKVSGDFEIRSDLIKQLMECTNFSTIEASVGLVTAYNVPKFLEHFKDQIYQETELPFLLAMALSSYKDSSYNESLLPLFRKFLESENVEDVIMALFGIIVLYGGNSPNNANLFEIIYPLLLHSSNEVVFMAILACGCIYMNNASDNIITFCCDSISTTNTTSSPFYPLAILGIGLLFYKRLDLLESPLFYNLKEPLFSLALAFIHTGTGNTPITEKILENCFTEDKNSLQEAIGLISASIVAISDPVATESLKSLLINSNNINTASIKNVVPLCLSLLYASTSDGEIVDTLERFISAKESAVSSLIGLGIVGAGSNSSNILKIIANNYNYLFREDKTTNAMVLSHGLVSLGKGLLTLNPHLYHDSIMLEKSFIGLLINTFLFVDSRANFFKNYSFMLYSIALSATPKYVVGIESEVTVGRPVDTVGLLGNPNKISGATVFNLPVLLNTNQRAVTTKTVLTEYVEDVIVEKDV